MDKRRRQRSGSRRGGKRQERVEVRRGRGRGGRRKQKGERPVPCTEDGQLVTRSPALQGQCQCAQLRELGDNCSSPGEKIHLDTQDNQSVRITWQSPHAGAGCRQKWGQARPRQEVLGARLCSFTQKHSPFPHPSQIFHDRERKQDPTTETHGFHLAFLIQSLVYAFLVREQSSDGFNGALSAVLGAFHQFFLKIASLISLNTLISLV